MYCNVIVRVENNNYIAISSFRQLQLQCHNIYNIQYIVHCSIVAYFLRSELIETGFLASIKQEP